VAWCQPIGLLQVIGWVGSMVDSAAGDSRSLIEGDIDTDTREVEGRKERITLINDNRKQPYWLTLSTPTLFLIQWC